MADSGLRLRWLAVAAGAAGLVFLLLAAWLVRPFWQLSGQFAEHRSRQPSRLYARALRLEAGGALRLDDLVAELRALGYRPLDAEEAIAPASFRAAGGRVAFHQRPHPTPDGPARGSLVEARFRGRRIERLEMGGEEVSAADLEPVLLASYYGPDFEERRPVAVDELPEDVVQAVLAAEDDSFFRHGGISVSGVLRAAWINLRGQEVRQGGSTITQQLVKNLFLTHERTFARKAQEALLALLLELRYEKRTILEVYLNEIYWGRSGPANLIGVGAAARAYYGKDATQLELDEAAVLAGMIRSPGELSPVTHPDRAVRRRDWVLDRLAELGWVERERLAAAKARPLRVTPVPVAVKRAPYFIDACALEARRRFGVATLEDAGYTLLSTLGRRDQELAEKALADGISELEKGWQKGRGGRLQAALVSLDPKSGGILAYVGGRGYRDSQFDRAGQARRQAGSAFKPVVYATAFEHGVASPATLLEDEPLTLTLAGRTWSPRNDDHSFHGWVSAREALEKSHNVATARLGLAVGLERIVETARRLGITTPLEPFPALALGAFEVTPVELATVYATFANGGVRPPVHGLDAVFDAEGARVAGSPLPEPQRALSPEATYLLNSVLQGVLDRGTGAGVRALGVGDPLAGKTGTTNGRRDSWFGGYAPTRATLVWVGYDDNSATRLSGARAALPIWGRFTTAVRPVSGYPMFPQPGGVATAVIDPASGGLATEDCPQVMTEVFLEGQVPSELCPLHRGWFTDPLDQPWETAEAGPRVEPRPRDEERGVRSWLRRVFGRDRRRPDTWRNPPAPPPPSEPPRR